MEGWTELGIGNRLALDDNAILANINGVQTRNEITPSAALETLPSTDQSEQLAAFYNFSVEMETGTGKTYVYLRTILSSTSATASKVHHRGAERGYPRRRDESIEMTHEHFRTLYGNCPSILGLRRQAGIAAAPVRRQQHAADSGHQYRRLQQERHRRHPQGKRPLSGRKPIEFVQAARPIVDHRRAAEHGDGQGQGSHRQPQPALHAALLGHPPQPLQPGLPARPGARLTT